MIKAGEFDNIFLNKNEMPQIDTIRNSLKSISLEELQKINKNIIKKACRNKVLADGAINGNAVEAILYLMFIASNLFQLFKVWRLKKHIIIQKELARLLLKELYKIEKLNDLILSSG